MRRNWRDQDQKRRSEDQKTRRSTLKATKLQDTNRKLKCHNRKQLKQAKVFRTLKSGGSLKPQVQTNRHRSRHGITVSNKENRMSLYDRFSTNNLNANYHCQRSPKSISTTKRNSPQNTIKEINHTASSLQNSTEETELTQKHPNIGNRINHSSYDERTTFV